VLAVEGKLLSQKEVFGDESGPGLKRRLKEKCQIRTATKKQGQDGQVRSMAARILQPGLWELKPKPVCFLKLRNSGKHLNVSPGCRPQKEFLRSTATKFLSLSLEKCSYADVRDILETNSWNYITEGCAGSRSGWLTILSTVAWLRG